MTQKRTSYSLAQKSEIIEYALDHHIKDACAKYKVHKSMLSRWIKNQRLISAADPSRKRLLGRTSSRSGIRSGARARVQKKLKSGQEHRLAHILNDISDDDESVLSSISTTTGNYAGSIGSSSVSDLRSDTSSTSSVEECNIPTLTIPSKSKNTKPSRLTVTEAGPTVKEAAMTLWLLTQASQSACGATASLIWTN